MSNLKVSALSLALLAASVAQAAPATDNPPAAPNPWGFNLSVYTWLPGVTGKFSAGPFSKDVDASFIDIAGKLRNFPLAFNGRLEAHYERFGIYLDGNYMSMDFKPRLDGGISKGLSNDLSILEYGASYRLFGPASSERVANWSGQSRSNILDVYVGGRTMWMDNKLVFNGIGSASASSTLTTPLFGGRFIVEFSPEWFMLVDGNIGGFSVENVDFVGSILGSVGYRTTLFGLPTSIEAGYKALRVEVSKPNTATKETLNGMFVGFTGYW